MKNHDMLFQIFSDATQTNYSILRGFSCIIRSSPYILLHVVKRPYRQDIPAIDYSYSPGAYSRYRLACFDALFNIVLDGYIEVSGQPVLSTTGQFFFFALELTKSLDEVIDEALGESTAKPLCAADLLAHCSVQKNLDDVKNYLRISNAPDEKILTYLKGRFDDFFDRYIGLSKEAVTSKRFDDILRVAELDNGLWMSSMADMIAMFNRHSFSNRVRQDFHNFGMVGKLIDDIVDVKRDLVEGRSNLLYALVTDHDTSIDQLNLVLASEQRLSLNWWIKCYPSAYTEYLRILNHYLGLIQSNKLRLACDIMLLPTVLGYDYDPVR